MRYYNFNTQTGHVVQVDADRCMCNNVILPGEYNPRNVKPYIIGNEHGTFCLVWATCDGDALDTAVNASFLDCLKATEKDLDAMTAEERSELSCLGDAGEMFDLKDVWLEPTILSRKMELLFAEARGANVDNLDLL